MLGMNTTYRYRSALAMIAVLVILAWIGSAMVAMAPSPAHAAGGAGRATHGPRPVPSCVMDCGHALQPLYVGW